MNTSRAYSMVLSLLPLRRGHRRLVVVCPHHFAVGVHEVDKEHVVLVEARAGATTKRYFSSIGTSNSSVGWRDRDRGRGHRRRRVGLAAATRAKRRATSTQYGEQAVRIDVDDTSQLC
jgi:hypothetical protein